MIGNFKNKTKFLLHTCCAPCGIAVIEELNKTFSVTAFFYNPNIFPEEEYLKRKKYVIEICQEWDVPIIDLDYEARKWHDAVASGLEQVKEGGARCGLCFKFRLAKTVEYARDNGFKHWGTSLTMGRNKDAKIIGAIAKSFSEHYGIKYYDVDWKTSGRQEKAAKMVKERGIYRQKYCGCEYSLDH